MIIKRKIRLAMQTAATTLTFALAIAGPVGATTTIGSNISTDGTLTVASTSTLQAAASITSTTNPQLSVKYDANNYWTEGVGSTGVVTFTRYGSALQKGFTFASTVAVASSTLETLLTVESTSTSNASTTLAVYQFGTGDIFRLYDSGTQVFTVKDGGTIGVATSTPWGLLAVEQSTETYSFIVSNQGSTTPAFIITGTSGADGGGRIGIATSTPWGLLAVEQSTETYSFIVGNSGSSTPSFVVSGVNKDGRVGVATSSPSSVFSIGKNSTGNATGTMLSLGFNNTTDGTTTVDLGRVCFRSLSDAGTTIYWWFTAGRNGNAGINIATSTTSCY